MKWMEFGCETSLLAEMPETRQHFFLFSRFFIFTRGYPRCRMICEGGREAHLLAERVKACQYFFKDFPAIPLTADDPRGYAATEVLPRIT